ncbi:MAG: UDP-3-O-acyl-N-acetylglucosamine deacetylase [Planctomycetaceae bacterium]|nr:UDP-3-O-acyl-N-acetylglucosamine deacetylase [Planctomycetaceae bacterium]
MPETARMQQTLAKPSTVEGFGFWTGKDVRVELHPAPVGAGVYFVRVDLPERPVIPVIPECHAIKPRQTSLAKDGVQIDMTEHLLAALYGFNIDNCEVRINAAEMPGIDGSSRVFASAILQGGITTQPAIRPRRIVYKNIRVGDDEHWIEAKPSFNGLTTFVYHLDYGPNSPIERQSYRFVFSPENFVLHLMSCRTFLTKREADQLLAAGMCSRVSPKDVLVFDDDKKPIDNKLIYPDECARHKVLDMLGDFSLGNCDWVGELVAYRSGHHLNIDCVRELLKKTVLLESDTVSAHTTALTAKK